MESQRKTIELLIFELLLSRERASIRSEAQSVSVLVFTSGASISNQTRTQDTSLLSDIYFVPLTPGYRMSDIATASQNVYRSVTRPTVYPTEVTTVTAS